MSITQNFIIIAYISKACIIIRKLSTYNFWVRFDSLNNKIDRKINFFHIKKGGDTVHGGYYGLQYTVLDMWDDFFDFISSPA
jgi:hypothetical protein